MQQSTLDRRRFVVGSILLGCSAAALKGVRAWAQTAAPIDASLIRMARLLYPHDALADSVYAQILGDALGATASDSTFAATLAMAESSLNDHRGRDFLELSDGDQLAVLQESENLEFFTTIQTAVRIRLYNHPAFWNLIGYEGSSWQRGGYLNRGAGEIDWLPEAQ